LGTGANKLAREAVKLMWSDEEKRLQLVSGKELLARLSEWAKAKYGVSFGSVAILRHFRTAEVPAEMRTVLEAVEYCRPFLFDTDTPRRTAVTAANPVQHPVAAVPGQNNRSTERT
jgi:hypothetical protein